MTSKDIPAVDKALKREFKAHSAPIIELIEAQTHDPFCVLVGTILSARTKDQCTAGAVRRRHIIRNSMVSTVTLLSMRMAALLGGSVIIETVFALPGIGKLTYDAISARDYTVVQSVVFLFALLVLVVNLLTDIIYSFLDPRVEF